MSASTLRTANDRRGDGRRVCLGTSPSPQPSSRRPPWNLSTAFRRPRPRPKNRTRWSTQSSRFRRSGRSRPTSTYMQPRSEPSSGPPTRRSEPAWGCHRYPSKPPKELRRARRPRASTWPVEELQHLRWTVRRRLSSGDGHHDDQSIRPRSAGGRRHQAPPPAPRRRRPPHRSNPASPLWAPARRWRCGTMVT